MKHLNVYWGRGSSPGTDWEFFSSPPRPASYPKGNRGSFPGGKAAGAWSWPLTSIKCRGL